MRKLFFALCMFAFVLTSCGSAKDSIEVTGYEWTVTLDSYASAKGVEKTESEAREAIRTFSKCFDSKVRTSKVKRVTKNIRKNKF